MNDTGHERNVYAERYAYTLLLLALGITLLGHGFAATVYADGPTPVTVALPLVGSLVAYLSFVQLLPAESSLSDGGFLGLLAALTTGFVNLAVPVVATALFPTAASPPTYWSAFLVGFAGFTTLGVYELVADGVSGRYALVKLLTAGVAAVTVGGLLLVAPARPGRFLTPVEATAGLGGAVLAVSLFDYAKVETAAIDADSTRRTADAERATDVDGASQ